MNMIEGAADARWTSEEVVTWLAAQDRHLSAVTWRAYASRGQAPAPQYTGRTPTWAPAEVAEWHRTRTRTAPPPATPAPKQTPNREQVAALRAESDRLFAEMHVLLEQIGPRDAARAEPLEAALRRQQQAYDAEDQAYGAWDGARQAQRDGPDDPVLSAAAEHARAAYRAAHARIRAEDEANRQIMRRVLDEQHADHDRFARASQAFQDAQDAAIDAE